MDTIINVASQLLVDQTDDRIYDYEQLAIEVPRLDERINAIIVDLEHRANWYDGLSIVSNQTDLTVRLLLTM